MKCKVEYNFRAELKEFIDAWGDHAQETVCMEECSELIKTLCKKHRGNNNQEDIIEETADVLITALQMAEINGYEAVMKIVSKKIKRARKRLKKVESKVYEETIEVS
jgi:NTP pyrophosphatase (non-canonical NTP hydrolase)